jgi:hypothetical protein
VVDTFPRSLARRQRKTLASSGRLFFYFFPSSPWGIGDFRFRGAQLLAWEEAGFSFAALCVLQPGFLLPWDLSLLLAGSIVSFI